MRTPQQFCEVVERELLANPGHTVILFAVATPFAIEKGPSDRIWPEFNDQLFREVAEQKLKEYPVIGSAQFSEPDELDEWTFYANRYDDKR